MDLTSHSSLAAIAIATLLAACSSSSAEDGAVSSGGEALQTPDAGIYCEEFGRFQARGGVVVDLTSDAGAVEWQQDVAPGSFTQSAAAAYCDTLALDGGGWRLPTVLELRSLVLYPVGLGGSHAPTCVPSIDQVAFPATPVTQYWTNETHPSHDEAWYVDFSDGRSHPGDPETPMSQRCVRTQAASL